MNEMNLTDLKLQLDMLSIKAEAIDNLACVITIAANSGEKAENFPGALAMLRDNIKKLHEEISTIKQNLS